MMGLIKSAIRQLPFYPLVRRQRLRRALQAWTERDEAHRRFYSQFIGPADLVFDVGAHLGSRTKVFSRQARHVVAVEPQIPCMEVLRSVFGKDDRVTLIPKAVGAEESSTEMFISDAPIISSLSSSWIASVRASGRFAEYNWSKKQKVDVTTLDALIDQHGVPSFIKIDVEGFEPEVLRGLSRPVASLSFEFTPEYLEATRSCLKRLSSLGTIECNFSLGETFELALARWTTAEAIEDALKRYDDGVTFGDVYVRFVST